MPTVSWINEGDNERYWEARGEGRKNRPPSFTCSQCQATFATLKSLRTHIAASHPLPLPRLIVMGRPVPKELTVRRRLTRFDVLVLNANECIVSENGHAELGYTPKGLKQRLIQMEDSVVAIRLRSTRAADGAVIEHACTLTLSIPDESELNHIDSVFIDRLVVDQLRYEDISVLMNLHVNARTSRDYLHALANYVLALVLKERRVPITSDAGVDRFAELMREAYEVLAQFDRPVAKAVVCAIRFNLNDFTSRPDDPPEFEPGFGFFSSVMGFGGSSTSFRNVGGGKICPIDNVTSALLRGCRAIRKSEIPLEEARYLSDFLASRPIVVQSDRLKAEAILGQLLLQAGALNEAELRFKHIAHDPSIGPWAQLQIQRCTNE